MKSTIWNPVFQAENYNEAIAIAEELAKMNKADIEVNGWVYPREQDKIEQGDTHYSVSAYDEFEVSEIRYIIETINNK